MTSYRFSYTPYQREFRQPLQTSHGLWAVREGIIVTLTTDRGISHQGEIAPIPGFGSESMTDAIGWCENVGKTITDDRIYEIPDTLPACQFGVGSALMAFNQPSSPHDEFSISLSGLLPTGATAIASWQDLWERNYSTFKWKIGVAPIAQEVSIWEQLIAALPATAKLRLDANGGLTDREAEQWLKLCEDKPQIEFIEQPLIPQRLDEIFQLAKAFSTPIALDESVATFSQLQTVYQQGWQGIYVIKPGIAGFPWRLCEFLNTHQLDVVLSSVLETHIGRAAALKLVPLLGLEDRAMGFGIDSWF